MPRRELRCPCGGQIEERGNVRYYGSGVAVMSIDGHREWVGDTWKTEIDTLDIDDPPYHCLECDSQLGLDDLVLMPLERAESASPGQEAPWAS